MTLSLGHRRGERTLHADTEDAQRTTESTAEYGRERREKSGSSVQSGLCHGGHGINVERRSTTKTLASLL